jgi:hypothetical protein
LAPKFASKPAAQRTQWGRPNDIDERVRDVSLAPHDFVVDLAHRAGWEFGAATAGHLFGQFPHERAPGNARRFSIRHGNDVWLREPDAHGNPRHWILEIHFVDRGLQIGGFFEELLTVSGEVAVPQPV